MNRGRQEVARLTPEQLAEAAQALFGFDRPWRRPLAEALKRDYRLVRRWASGERPVPAWVPERLRELAGERIGELGAILGEGSAGRRRYRFDMRDAYEQGRTDHPQREIQRIAPDADDFEPISLADCWDFTADPITDLPPFIRELAKL